MSALKHPERVTASQAIVLRWLAERGAVSSLCLVRYAGVSMHALWRRGLVTLSRHSMSDTGDFVVTDKGRAWLKAHPEPPERKLGDGLGDATGVRRQRQRGAL